MSYETFSEEIDRATNLFNEAKADISNGRISSAKEKLEQVKNELRDCSDPGAKALADKAETLLEKT